MSKGNYVSKAAVAVEQFRPSTAGNEETGMESAEAVAENKKKKSKCGRPYLGPVKRVSLAVPLDLYEGVEDTASLFYRGSITAYINDLIRKDLEENTEKYTELRKLMKRS